MTAGGHSPQAQGAGSAGKAAHQGGSQCRCWVPLLGSPTAVPSLVRVHVVEDDAVQRVRIAARSFLGSGAQSHEWLAAGSGER